MGRHSDSIDVTGPIDVTGLEEKLGKRGRNLTLSAIAAAVFRRRHGGDSAHGAGGHRRRDGSRHGRG